MSDTNTRGGGSSRNEQVAATVWFVCPKCGVRSNHIHDGACHSCSPYVPPGTPNSVEVTWWVDLNPQTFA